MIKATFGRGDDGKVRGMMLGLSHANLDRLRAGDPIVFNTSEIGLDPMEVIVFSASTEKAIVDELTSRGLVGPTTTVHGTPDGE